LLAIRKRLLEEEDPDTLDMADLTFTYWNQERWKEAEELGRQALAMRKKVLGQERVDTLTSVGNIASTYSDQGR
jgi:hypothetical protein